MFHKSPFLLAAPILGVLFLLFIWPALKQVFRGLGGQPEQLGAALYTGRSNAISQTGRPGVQEAALSSSAWISREPVVVEPAPTALDLPWTVAPQAPVDPVFEAFMLSVIDGQAGIARGMYITDKLALPILQQPAKDATYVSSKDGTVTQFSSAAEQGTTGLLAHNYLSGILFYTLAEGDVVNIIYGDGYVRRYAISGIHQYQRLDFTRLSGDFIDLSTGERQTSNQVFSRFYAGGDRVTMQTCLERNGNASWGLTFVVAEPIP
jgi:hypothetical protein